jgi:uncharacterized membrane protein
MKKKKGLIYVLLSISTGYLFYNYLFTDYGFGMMNHHYGYYDDYSRIMYYLNSSLVFVSYTVIIISTIILLSNKTESTNYAMTILDERLSKGEISVEEYQKIKGVINNK